MALETNFSTEDIRMGICRVYVGDPTVAGGMIHLGETAGDITFNPNPEIVHHKLKGMAAPARSFNKGYAATATTPLAEEEKTKLFELMSGAGALTLGALGGGSSRAATELVAKTLLLIPEDEVDMGVEAPHAIWIWRAVANGPGAFTFGEVQEDAPAHDVEWTAHFDSTKPEKYNVFCIGNPNDAGIVVTL